MLGSIFRRWLRLDGGLLDRMYVEMGFQSAGR